MNVAMYSSKQYDRLYFGLVNKNYGHQFDFLDFRLTKKTAILAEGYEAVCIFVNDEADEEVIKQLHDLGVKYIALRCAGFNNVDLDAAKKYGMSVVRVPAYSPESVAEYTIGLMMTLNRRIHRAYQRTRDANFSLEGLIGFNMHQRTVGVIGTGKIGVATIRILNGFGMNILAYDPYQNQTAIDLGAKYVDLDTLYANSDVITLHCPMTPENYHMINASAFKKMKDGVMLINTSRGGLLDSKAAIHAVESGKVGSLGLDVYENEHNLFFEDKSNDIIRDDVFRRLSSCHNVLFTGHQAFLTEEALRSIADVTLNNLTALENGKICENIV